MKTPGTDTPNPSADAVVGAVVDGKYRVEALLGRGGTGRVYRAKQLSLGRMVALKVMRPDLEGDERRIEISG